MELVLPMCNSHPYFSLKNLGKKMHIIHSKIQYAFIGWFLYAPWPGIEPAALMYWVDALTIIQVSGPLFPYLGMIILSVLRLK